MDGNNNKPDSPSVMAGDSNTKADEKFVIALYHSYLGRIPTPEDILIYKDLDKETAKTLVFDRSKLEKDIRADIANKETRDQAAKLAAEASEKAAAAEAEKVKKLDGAGGPTTPVNYGESGWYFPQDTILVKFNADPTKDDANTGTQTVWLYNKNNNVLIPFQSEESFNKLFKGQMTLQDAETRELINPIDSGLLLNPSSPFYKPTMIGFNNGFNKDGRIPSPTQALWAYGRKPSTQSNLAGATYVKNLIGLMKDTPDTGVKPEFLDSLLNNRDEMARLISAKQYGQYSISDLYKDIKARALAADGDPKYARYAAFDQINDSSSYASPADPKLTIPRVLGGMNTITLDDSFMYKAGLYDNPLDIKKYTPDTEENKKALEAIDAKMYDAAIQQLSAKTESEKAVADDNWRMIKESLEQKYQISLSNNAFQAWNQIKQIEASMVQRGIANTGVMNEANDWAIKTATRNDDDLRASYKNEMDEQKRNYYLSTSPEQIAKDRASGLLTEDEMNRWGMKPAASYKQFITDLKKNYPNITDDELKTMTEAAFDANGVWRNPTYQTLHDAIYKAQQERGAFKDEKLRNQLDEELRKIEESLNPNSLAGTVPDPADERKVKFLTEAPQYKNEVSATSSRRKISGPSDLATIRAELTRLGVPKTSWNSFISSPTATDKTLYYTPPAAKAYTSIGADGKRVAVDPTGKIKNSVPVAPSGYKMETTSPAKMSSTDANFLKIGQTQGITAMSKAMGSPDPISPTVKNAMIKDTIAQPTDNWVQRGIDAEAAKARAAEEARKKIKI